MKKLPAVLLPIAAVTAAQIIGAQRGPLPDQPRTAAWYARLEKPGFTPPKMVFPVAWTTLSGLLAYSGYRLLRARPAPVRTAAITAWSTNLLGIAGFSWVLFGRKRLDEALGITAAMVVTSAATATLAGKTDRKAGLAILPLLAWTTFATILQEEVWRRNQR